MARWITVKPTTEPGVLDVHVQNHTGYRIYTRVSTETLARLERLRLRGQWRVIPALHPEIGEMSIIMHPPIH